MTRSAADWGSGERLLGQAIAYALENVAAITSDLLATPTPCPGWDLRMLLWHSCESLAALREGLAAGRVSLAGSAPAGSGARNPVATYTVSAVKLLECLANPASQDVRIGGLALPRSTLAAAGALEVAVHGWDVAQACGSWRPVPFLLASDLLTLAPLLVPSAGRAPLFGDPVRVGRDASPSEQLTAFLGRVAAVPPDPSQA
jgi:uncharacterized protein (TIGR03086 family)